MHQGPAAWPGAAQQRRRHEQQGWAAALNWCLRPFGCAAALAAGPAACVRPRWRRPGQARAGQARPGQSRGAQLEASPLQLHGLRARRAIRSAGHLLSSPRLASARLAARLTARPAHPLPPAGCRRRAGRRAHHPRLPALPADRPAAVHQAAGAQALRRLQVGRSCGLMARLLLPAGRWQGWAAPGYSSRRCEQLVPGPPLDAAAGPRCLRPLQRLPPPLRRAPPPSHPQPPKTRARRSRDNIRTVLQSVYRNQSSVDDELVDIIYGPSEEPGALEVFVSVITGGRAGPWGLGLGLGRGGWVEGGTPAGRQRGAAVARGCGCRRRKQVAA